MIILYIKQEILLGNEMSKTLNSIEIIDQYIQSCNIIYEATLIGDFKSNNKEGKKIIKLYKILETNLQLANDCLEILMKNRNVVVKTKAASHCIALNIRVSEAKNIQETVAKDKENGIFGFNAQMTLDVWKNRGFLKVY